MEINITIGGRFLTNWNLLLYNSILSRWFYVPVGSQKIPVKPKLLSSPEGFKLNGKLVRTVLFSCDEYEISKTDADAILSHFYFIPGNEKLKRILSIPEKPAIISIDYAFITTSGVLSLAKKLESFGAAGLYAGRKFPVDMLNKICSECTLPVFAASDADIGEITSKINAGAYALCISGKDISTELIRLLHQSFPGNPVLAMCNKSEKQMQNSVISGIDAVIFQPCIPLPDD
ncbi:MAG TPA: hypothetical protein DER09_07120 [Prolixibacteraceae bacterium]|nr:hypothetical protein [Prolixibacteraceae bacterium]